MKVFVIGTISGNFMLPPSGARSQNHSVDNKGRDHGSFSFLTIIFNSLSCFKCCFMVLLFLSNHLFLILKVVIMVLFFLSNYFQFSFRFQMLLQGTFVTFKSFLKKCFVFNLKDCDYGTFLSFKLLSILFHVSNVV